MEHTRISWGFIGIFQQRNGCNKIVLFVYSSGTKDKNTRDFTKTGNHGTFIDIGYLRPMGIWLVVPGTRRKIMTFHSVGNVMSSQLAFTPSFFRGIVQPPIRKPFFVLALIWGFTQASFRQKLSLLRGHLARFR
jgi:hypothetical protein